MSYKVSAWMTDEAALQEAKFYLTRKQAIHGMRKLAYAKLEAFGKLDTQAAHDVMAHIDRCDDILQPQECRAVKISNTGYSLLISNTARAPR